MTTTTPEDARPHWMPAPEDELPHTPPPDREDLPWKDTWLFPMRDPSSGVVVTVHMTISPNRGNSCRTSFVVVDGNRREMDVQRGQVAQTQPEFVGNELATLEVVDPRWDANKRLRWRGGNANVRFELDVEGVHPAIEFSALCPGMMPRSETNELYHVEQWVRFSGWIEWSGQQRQTIQGEGWRDRSWGWRKSERSLSRGWIAALGRITDGPSFGVLTFPHADIASGASAPLGAWLADDDGVTTATSASLRRQSTGFPEAIDLTFADGRALHLTPKQQNAEVIYSFHDADVGGSGWAVQGVDYFADMVDQHGRVCRVIADYGTPLLADAFRDSTLVPGADEVATP